MRVLGVEDIVLNETIERCTGAAAKRTEGDFQNSLKCESAPRLRVRMGVSPTAGYSQMWRPSREHEFPLNLPLHRGHEEVKEIWARFLSRGEYYPQKYVIRHAIDTNQVEGIFWLFPEVRSRPSVGSRSQTGIVGARLCSSGCGRRLHHAEQIRCHRCWSLRLDQERHPRNRFS